MAENNEFRITPVDIGLENVAVAATRVVGLASLRNKKGFKNVDAYNTLAKLITFINAEARAAGRISRAIYSARAPLEQALLGNK